MTKPRPRGRDIRRQRQHQDRYRAEQAHTPISSELVRELVRPERKPDRPRPPSRPTASNYQPERRRQPQTSHRCNHCPAWVEGRWVDGDLVSLDERHLQTCAVQHGARIPLHPADWLPR